jgi:hypothetical protein
LIAKVGDRGSSILAMHKLSSLTSQLSTAAHY